MGMFQERLKMETEIDKGLSPAVQIGRSLPLFAFLLSYCHSPGFIPGKFLQRISP